MSSQPEFTPSGLRLRVFNEEVLFAAAPLSTLSRQDIEWLKARAAKTARQRVRICAHLDSNDRLHEMFIVHTRDTYVRPHKHLNKSESFHVITGEVDVVLFDQQGAVRQVIPMGDYPSGKRFYYRLNEPDYHTLLIRSDVIVFHEVTTGPFQREDTVFPTWAPEEGQAGARRDFLAGVERAAALSLGAKPQITV
jgi:cupin fold WbuC family metalloprotein